MLKSLAIFGLILGLNGLSAAQRVSGLRNVMQTEVRADSIKVTSCVGTVTVTVTPTLSSPSLSSLSSPPSSDSPTETSMTTSSSMSADTTTTTTTTTTASSSQVSTPSVVSSSTAVSEGTSSLSSSIASSVVMTSSATQSSMAAECTPPVASPACPANTNDTALTSGQFYRVVCDGVYEASTNISVTIHPTSYSLADCVNEGVAYNRDPNPTFGPCVEVLLKPRYSNFVLEAEGAPPDQKECRVLGGTATNSFESVPNQGWESAFFLSNSTALTLACGFGEGMVGWRFR